MASKALLARLTCLFQEDPLIDEVGFLLFNTESSDLTPETAFTLANHKLGVAFAAGIPLFQAARTQFLALNAYFQQGTTESTQSPNREQCAQLLHCTRALLLISADYYTAWNTRKSFVTRGWLDAQDEMQFTNLVFTLHPKSIDTWAYRRWLANRVCQSLSEANQLVFYKQQIEVCSRLAERKVRNYHAWSFRHWIVSRLSMNQTHKELKDMERWCRMHITDHSGWNHRQHTLTKLLKDYRVSGEIMLCKKLILAEYEFVSEIMAPYPTHEALWCHRRYVWQCLLDDISRRKSTCRLDLAFLQDLISGVAEKIVFIIPESQDRATLTASWNQQLKQLRSESETLVLGAIVNEISIAWTCGYQFSRRFSAWCIKRLRVCLCKQQTFGDKASNTLLLDSLALILQKRMIQGDCRLKDLWLGAFKDYHGE